MTFLRRPARSPPIAARLRASALPGQTDAGRPTEVVLLGTTLWHSVIFLAQAVLEAGLRPRIVGPNPLPPPLVGLFACQVVPAWESQDFRQALLELAADPSVAWIVPVHDEALPVCLAEIGDSPKLLPRFSAENRQRLRDKHTMRAFAASLGMAVPASIEVQSADAAWQAAQILGYPAVLKGAGGFGGSQVRICTTPDELGQHWPDVSAHRPAVQTFIPGAMWGAGGYFMDGAPCAVHLYEVLEQDPPGIGPPVRIRHDAQPELLAHLLGAMRALRWSGFAQMDFVRDPQGRFVFMEINPRPWGSMSATRVAGNNLYAPWIDHLLGRVPRVDLCNRDGWTGYLFPNPVGALAARGDGLGLLKLLITPAYWRSRPPMLGPVRMSFLKTAWWQWLHARRRPEAG